MEFEPVPLPSPPPGGLSAAWLEPALRKWAASPPLRALAGASGWPWPEGADTAALLSRLAELSDDWNFRAERERNFIESDPAEVNGRVVPDDLVKGAARALGLVDATPAPAGRFSAVLVLSGLVSACVNRTRRTAELLREGLDARSVAVLTGHRKLGGKEPDQARELGLGRLFDEADAVLAATREAFGLGDPELAERSRPRLTEWDDSLWGASGRYRWAAAGQSTEVEVLIVPSADPVGRRVNTADQLRCWSERAGIGAADRVLLVTTQIYVPFQQFDGLRMLGLNRGCAVSACGVDAGTAYLPMKEFGGRSYLQEVRSALRAASALLAAAHQAGH
jgi:hypothetical protein